ncbi:SPOSA6832_03163 [Sporobolomyces salmonicolor]|uniref:SPOSA6832_03163-mRNA-1:cds n=1 Tax=Sporidiobolus salmonicolor TaxID=5005 RepID=A0A0D6ENT1_SPOSA|nr:SPOSA6832_03163 [Sporobolomyces salmonicolor]
MGESTASSKPSRSRKPVAATSAKAAASRSRSKKAAVQVDEVDEEDDIAGARDDGEDDDGDDELGAAEGTTLIPETQFERADEAASGKRGGKKAPVKKTSAAMGGRKTAAKEDVAPEQEQEDDFDAEEDVGKGKPSPREKKLQAQLDATKKALADVQLSFKTLSELRHTRAEEAESRLREIADERQQAAANTVQTYKTESDVLRSEISSLQEAAFASPRTKAARANNARIAELEEENTALAARIEELEKEREAREEEFAREADERERRWERKLREEVKAGQEKMRKETAQMKADLDTTRTELTAEVAHSKSLQAKLKTAGPPSSSTSLPSSTTISSSAQQVEKLTDDVNRLTQKLQLNEDLTGFAVHSVKDDPMGLAFTCVLNDCWGQSGGLNFKLVFHIDGTVSYTPDVDSSRDGLLTKLLPSVMQNYMRFEAGLCSEWFCRLFNAVNKQQPRTT